MYRSALQMVREDTCLVISYLLGENFPNSSLVENICNAYYIYSYIIEKNGTEVCDSGEVLLIWSVSWSQYVDKIDKYITATFYVTYALQ